MDSKTAQKLDDAIGCYLEQISLKDLIACAGEGIEEHLSKPENNMERDSFINDYLIIEEETKCH
jgi:hypothetical protein